ncbi:hypothetical protein HO173_006971 [Letharia columbiana]|uniref:Uncharacterized protein n=1 Tax=Letharia columbiana TaxID=112416 RepID=A0A8H6FU41_9LECA|nr:uncharacterized protein HO173_006971 [Letharia columbiana]KAF6234751.1 hypothetical protein HO173_006971 [Letharia columbiana]
MKRTPNKDATQLCAAVGGTPVDNAAAISSFFNEAGAAALHTSFEADGLASSRLAIASSQDIANSLQIEDGGAAPATTTGNTVSATVTPTGTSMAGTGNFGGPSSARTGTAAIAAFTGGVGGRGGVPVAALGLLVWLWLGACCCESSFIKPQASVPSLARIAHRSQLALLTVRKEAKSMTRVYSRTPADALFYYLFNIKTRNPFINPINPK